MPAAKKKTIKRTKPVTDEEKILGVQPEVETIQELDYEDEKRLYKVTNLQVKNKPVIVDGSVIETFIGNSNKPARRALKEGAKSVTTKDIANQELYKIEVL